MESRVNSSRRSDGDAVLAWDSSNGVRYERALLIKVSVLRVGLRKLAVSSYVNSHIPIFMREAFDSCAGILIDFQG